MALHLEDATTERDRDRKKREPHLKSELNFLRSLLKTVPNAVLVMPGHRREGEESKEEPVEDSQCREDLSRVRGRAHPNLAGIRIPGREVQSSLGSRHRGQEVGQRNLRNESR
jgi:hypothetical protein